MKKIISITLVALMFLSCLSLVGCTGKEELKLGLGVVSAYGENTNADGEIKGSGSVVTTAAAVLLDKDGKIVQCVIDCVDAKVEFNSKGELTVVSEYKTKGELGTDYGMSKIGKTEWVDQIAALCEVAVGKTADEVKALLAKDGKGSQEVITAGCTVYVTDYVKALEKAMANAAESKATADNSLSLGFVTKMEKGANATAEKSGSVEVVANIAAAVTTAEGKTVVLKSDSSIAKFSFSATGVAETDTTKALASKLELGNDYNMAKYGADLNGDGVVKEWFEQAAAFDAACVDKTADEISALVVEGYGVDTLKTAGCTIAISDMVAAAVKAVK